VKKVLYTPIRNEDIEGLRIGDIVYLTGGVVTSRDDAHKRLVAGGVTPFFPTSGIALMHAGPIVKKKGSGWEMVSVGPTTSMRMERYEKDYIRLTGIKLIIGKGGMGADTVQACRDYKAVHTVFPGGCAVCAAECVEETLGVEWEDLGMPEAFWIMRVKEFGPLIVSIDTQGGSLFEDNIKRSARARKRRSKRLPGTCILKRDHNGNLAAAPRGRFYFSAVKIYRGGSESPSRAYKAGRPGGVLRLSKKLFTRALP
jgi:hydro-lyases, Fe-S type, tartrate/fumarate subfamily, beta region